MSTPSRFRSALYIFAALLVAAAAVFRISDLDFWWHLKTGQIILEQKAIPHTEIFSFTAAGREYVDHEWLFQAVSYLSYSAAGPGGVIFLKTGILILVFILAAQHLLRSGASLAGAAAVLMISLCGSVQRFIERPEIFSTLFLIGIFLLLDRYLREKRLALLALIPPVILIWSNIHAAVILALVVQAIFIAGILIENSLRRFGREPYYDASHREVLILCAVLLLSFLATAINPYGFRMLKVPFELTEIIESGVFQNEEWQRTTPGKLPLFFLCLIFAAGMHAIHYRRASLIHVMLTIFLGFIALKYVRNTGMFAMLMPFLIAPYADRLAPKSLMAGVGVALLGLSLWVLIYSFPFERGIGISSKFPENISRFVVDKNLQGNMLNSYGFGGYLIWKLYPERKIFIDGRNEVFLPLMRKIVESRADSRKWNQLLEEYRIEYALLNYIPELEKVTMLDRNNQARIVYMPFSSTHFPRIRWALIYFDDAGMVFVRRKGANENLLLMEYTSVYPEGRGYQESLVKEGKVELQKTIEELQRKLKEDPDCGLAQRLLRNIQRG